MPVSVYGGDIVTAPLEPAAPWPACVTFDKDFGRTSAAASTSSRKRLGHFVFPPMCTTSFSSMCPRYHASKVARLFHCFCILSNCSRNNPPKSQIISFCQCTGVVDSLNAPTTNGCFHKGFRGRLILLRQQQPPRAAAAAASSGLRQSGVGSPSPGADSEATSAGCPV